ncbi:MAG: prepilin-type N-terminal cleavage/methylation domain-containing protein [Akkermansiaceae bacterium]|nr:prepilin-type N-terminal cleavage/methylation domain-containing protein [Akkermansiaceae bacterium]
MKVTALNKKKGFTLIELMVVIGILAALASIGYGPILDHMNDGDRQKASSNLNSLHKVLQGFKSDNGSYPCDSTAERLQEEKPDLNFGALTGDTSNAYFRQVYYSPSNVSEKPFFAKVSCNGLAVATEGDEKLANGAALTRGENAMAYVMHKNSEDPNMKDGVTKSNAPLALCGIYPSTTPYVGDTVAFDGSSFRGHAFLLSCDGSVKDLERDLEEDESSDGDKYILPSGKSLFPETKKGRSTADGYLILSPEK